MWDAVLDPLNGVLEVFNTNWDKLLATLLILVGGWIIAKILKLMIVRGLKVVKLDVVAEKAGIAEFLKKGGIKQSAVEILGTLIYWIALILFLVMILAVWNIDVGLTETLVPFLPKIFAALVILILGLFLSSLVEDLVRATAANTGVRYAFYLAKTVKWILVIFVVMTALQQLDIQTEFVSWGFLIILGSFGLGMALALGLGTKDIVGRKVGEWVENIEKQAGETSTGDEG